MVTEKLGTIKFAAKIFGTLILVSQKYVRNLYYVPYFINIWETGITGHQNI